MRELREKAAQSLVAHGGSEAGFFQALAQAYAELGIGRTLDFAAVHAYWNGAELPLAWRHSLSACTHFDGHEKTGHGAELFATVRGWMLWEQSAQQCFVLGQRSAVLLAPLLRLSGLSEFFAPLAQRRLSKVQAAEQRQCAIDQMWQWRNALSGAAPEWAAVVAVQRAADADPEQLTALLRRVPAEKWLDPYDTPIAYSVLLLARLHLVDLLLREHLLLWPVIDAEWALGLLRELRHCYELGVNGALAVAAGGADLVALQLRPLARAAVQAPSLSQYLASSESYGGGLLSSTGLLEFLVEPAPRLQSLLQQASVQVLGSIEFSAEFVRRYPAQTFSLEQAQWQRARRFHGGHVDTPQARRWYRDTLGAVSDIDSFERAFRQRAEHCDAAQLRELIEHLCIEKKRSLPSHLAGRIDDCADLARYVRSSNDVLAQCAASQLRSRALDWHGSTRHEPYWSTLLALSAERADLLVWLTVSGDLAAIDSMQRWQQLWQNCTTEIARESLVRACLEALGKGLAVDEVLALAEPWYAQAPQRFRKWVECGEIFPGTFNAALHGKTSRLRELIPLVTATFLDGPRRFSSDALRLNPLPVSIALVDFPQSYAALERKHRLNLVPLMNAAAVVACGETLADVLSNATKPTHHALRKLMALTPLQALQRSGLLDRSEPKLRWLLLTAMAHNDDTAALAWIEQNLADRAHDDYSRGLALDALARSGHALRGLDDWAVDSLAQLQALAAKQKIPAAVAKAWNEDFAQLLQPLGEVLGCYLLRVLIEAGENLPRRARQILAFLPAARRGDFAAYGVKAWIAQDGADAFAWLLLPATVHGDERSANALVSAATAWMKKRKQKSSAALHLLCRLPGIYGSSQVRELWESGKLSESIQRNAEEALSEAAQRENLPLEAYLERLVPDFGFSREGLALQLGPYAYTAQLRGDFSVLLLDQNGKTVKALPAAKAGVDPQLREVAQNQLKALGKSLDRSYRQQSQRLLRAVQTAKTWPLAHWQPLFVAHPLLGLLGQAVVWSALDAQGQLLRHFRPSAGGEWIDAEDTVLQLPATVQLRVAHPRDLSVQELAQWRSQFADYRLVSPMDQFALPVLEPQPDELGDSRVRRADGCTLSRGTFGKLMEKWGYLKGEVGDGAMVGEHAWRPNAEWCVLLQHSEISVRFDAEEAVFVESIELWRNTGENEETANLEALSPAMLCTLLAQAEALKAAAIALG